MTNKTLKENIVKFNATEHGSEFEHFDMFPSQSVDTKMVARTMQDAIEDHLEMHGGIRVMLNDKQVGVVKSVDHNGMAKVSLTEDIKIIESENCYSIRGISNED